MTTGGFWVEWLIGIRQRGVYWLDHVVLGREEKLWVGEGDAAAGTDRRRYCTGVALLVNTWVRLRYHKRHTTAAHSLVRWHFWFSKASNNAVKLKDSSILGVHDQGFNSQRDNDACNEPRRRPLPKLSRQPGSFLSFAVDYVQEDD